MTSASVFACAVFEDLRRQSEGDFAPPPYEPGLDAALLLGPGRSPRKDA